MSTYEIIKDYTLVDIYRCYEIFTLIKQIEYIDGDVVEVGTYRGGTSGIISSVLNGFKLSKDFYAIDTFEGVVKVNHNDPSYKGGEHKASINEFKELFKKLNINLPTILTGIYPDDFPDFNIEKAADQLEWVLKHHDENREEYAAKNKPVLDRYTIKNEALVDTYEKLIDNLYDGKHELSREYDWKTNLYK